MNGGLARVIRGEKPSTDTIAYSMVNGNAGELKDFNAGITNRTRYNKVFSKCDDPRKVGLWNGRNEPYLTKTPCKGALGWSTKHYLGGKDGYHERAVALFYVGDGPHLLLGMERIKLGEGGLKWEKRRGQRQTYSISMKRKAKTSVVYL